MEREQWRRLVAPAAFLAAVTVAVVLVRAGLESGSSRSAAGPTTTAAVAASARRYYRVRAGDTFSLIASRTGVSVATLKRLNPKVVSTALFIGQRVRIR